MSRDKDIESVVRAARWQLLHPDTHSYLPHPRTSPPLVLAAPTAGLEVANPGVNGNGEDVSPDQVQVVGEARPAGTSPDPALERARALADAALTLAELRNAVESFDGCALKKTATQTVFADGDPQSKIMLIGEAPGANEDIQGIPFCGQSGKLLDNILKACRWGREGVYITNSVFWRPPDNRKPTPAEIAVCRPFVEKHIALVRPRLVIMVGSTAVEALMNVTQPMSQLRGNFYPYSNVYLQTGESEGGFRSVSESGRGCGIHLTPIYHPSYLLRQPGQKKQMWFDMLRIISYLAD